MCHPFRETTRFAGPARLLLTSSEASGTYLAAPIWRTYLAGYRSECSGLDKGAEKARGLRLTILGVCGNL